MEIEGRRFNIDGIKFELIKEPESQIEITDMDSTEREFMDGPTKEALWLVSGDGNTKVRVTGEEYTKFVARLMLKELCGYPL